nr:hypothetical protein [Sphingobium sp. YG1]
MQGEKHAADQDEHKRRDHPIGEPPLTLDTPIHCSLRRHQNGRPITDLFSVGPEAFRLGKRLRITLILLSPGEKLLERAARYGARLQAREPYCGLRLFTILRSIIPFHARRLIL